MCSKLGIRIGMKKTSGGHYGVPVTESKEEVSFKDYFHTLRGDYCSDWEYSENVVGDEADAVMLSLVSNCESDNLLELHKVI